MRARPRAAEECSSPPCRLLALRDQQLPHHTATQDARDALAQLQEGAVRSHHLLDALLHHDAAILAFSSALRFCPGAPCSRPAGLRWIRCGRQRTTSKAMRQRTAPPRSDFGGAEIYRLLAHHRVLFVVVARQDDVSEVQDDVCVGCASGRSWTSTQSRQSMR